MPVMTAVFFEDLKAAHLVGGMTFPSLFVPAAGLLRPCQHENWPATCRTGRRVGVRRSICPGKLHAAGSWLPHACREIHDVCAGSIGKGMLESELFLAAK
jgi:hypothetical protein